MSGRSGELQLQYDFNGFSEIDSVEELIKKMLSFRLEYDEESDVSIDIKGSDNNHKYQPAPVAMKEFCSRIATNIKSVDEIKYFEFSDITYSWGFEAVETADDLLNLIYKRNRKDSPAEREKKITESLLPGWGNSDFIFFVENDINNIVSIIYETVLKLDWETKAVKKGYRVNECQGSDPSPKKQSRQPQRRGNDTFSWISV